MTGNEFIHLTLLLPQVAYMGLPGQKTTAEGLQASGWCQCIFHLLTIFPLYMDSNKHHLGDIVTIMLLRSYVFVSFEIEYYLIFSLLSYFQTMVSCISLVF